MFGSMKKTMVAAAVIAVGGLAAVPGMASAEQWKVGGSSYAGPAQMVGTLSTTFASGWSVTCTVQARADLDNGAAGSVARGAISEYRLGSAAGGSCSSSAPNCSVSFMMPTQQWPISTAGRDVTISGIAYGITFSGGATCSLNGVTVGVYGAMGGAVAAGGSNAVSFTGSPGTLTTTLGPAMVSGALSTYVEGAAGTLDPTRPITLQS